jgi:hypothetical protein
LATSPAQLASLAGELRWSPGRRESLTENGLRLASPGAATATARAIVRRIQERR